MRRGWNSIKALALVAVMIVTGGMAGAEDLTPNGGRLAESLGVDPSGSEGRYNSAAGDLYADMLGASVSVQREFRRSLPSIYSYSQTAHYQNRADAGGASSAALANLDATNYYAVCPTTMCSPGSKWVMWDVPFMTRETRKGEGGYYGFDQHTSGFATGISRMLGETGAVGLAIGYDARKLSSREGYRMQNNADAFHAALYGGTNIGNFFFDAYAGYSYSRNRAERGVFEVDGGDFSINKANFSDTVWSAGLKASYVWILPNDMRITPSVGADFSHVRASSFSERSNEGADSLLRGDANNYSTVSMPVMVSVNKTFNTSFLAFGGHDALWTPEVRAGYVPEFGSKRADATLHYPGAANKFKAESTKLAGSYGTVGGGMKIKLRDKFIFAVDYDYTFGSDYENHSVTGMYGVSF